MVVRGVGSPADRPVVRAASQRRPPRIPYTTIARPTTIATIPQTIEPAAATRSAMTIERPMSRNANAVSTKATYSHTVSIA